MPQLSWQGSKLSHGCYVSPCCLSDHISRLGKQDSGVTEPIPHKQTLNQPLLALFGLSHDVKTSICESHPLSALHRCAIAAVHNQKRILRSPMNMISISLLKKLFRSFGQAKDPTGLVVSDGARGFRKPFQQLPWVELHLVGGGFATLQPCSRNGYGCEHDWTSLIQILVWSQVKRHANCEPPSNTTWNPHMPCNIRNTMCA